MGAGPQCSCNAQPGDRHLFNCPINSLPQNNYESEWWLSSGETNTPWKALIKCECGGDFVGNTHSHWCPKYEAF